MPLFSTRGAASGKAFGLTAGGASPIDFDYLVVAGGGAANGFISGGGGAGGYRTSFPGGTKITLKGGDNDITVGAGGVYVPANPRAGGQGVASSVAGLTTTITSAGGGTYFGWGATPPYEYEPTNPLATPTNSPQNQAIRDGGSGSGIGHRANDGLGVNAGNGNVPPVSPSQGNPGGGSGPNYYAGSGGGGASAAGVAGSAGGPGSNAGPGGDGTISNISGSPVQRAGGGGGGAYLAGGSNGGLGGGGDGGATNSAGTPGGTNFGGGGGGSGGPGVQTTGGSGIIILRCPSARVFTVSPGTNTITTEPVSGDQIATFTVTGKLKAIK
jgi:hypothetical protein